eukprot:4093580-Pyramimonas_sp.AAC.1
MPQSSTRYWKPAVNRQPGSRETNTGSQSELSQSSENRRQVITLSALGQLEAGGNESTRLTPGPR